jgi:hypothetical protein
MSIERRERRALASERAPASNHFGGAGAFQLFMVNLHMETTGAAPLLFCWKLNILKKLNGAASFSLTPQPNAPALYI